MGAGCWGVPSRLPEQSHSSSPRRLCLPSLAWPLAATTLPLRGRQLGLDTVIQAHRASWKRDLRLFQEETDRGNHPRPEKEVERGFSTSLWCREKSVSQIHCFHMEMKK